MMSERRLRLSKQSSQTFELPFILETDASDDCIGAALMQRVEGKDLSIASYSRSMTSAEKNYDTSQKELLAVVKSVEHFRQLQQSQNHQYDLEDG